MSESKQQNSQTTTGLVILLSAIGSTSSLGNLIVNVTRSEGGTASLPFLIVPLAAFLLAFLIIILEWDKSRNKWPGRLRKLTVNILPSVVIEPETADGTFRRIMATVYKEYYRIALSENRKDLAKDFEKEIKRWETSKD